MTKTLLIILAVILFVPNLFTINLFEDKGYNHREEYDPKLSYINSVARLAGSVDSLAQCMDIDHGSYEYVFEITRLIRHRFYHGYSHFNFRENWIAALCGRFIEAGFSAKVQPDKILQHSNAACSQQAIVMMDLLKQKHIPYRHLGFPHHYAIDVLINGKWYFFDPNMEPNMAKEQRCEDGWKYNSDSLKQYYDKSKMEDMEFALGDGLLAIKGPVNEVPAPNARLFQATTAVLSKILWCFPLLLLYLRSKKYFPFNRKKVLPQLA